MLANKILCLLSISANLIVMCQAFGFNDNFMGGFSQEMENMQNQMQNMQNKMEENMQNMKTEMKKSSKKMEEDLTLNVTELALKFEEEGSDIYFNTGGCKCKDFSCVCCNLVDALTETPNCYEFTYLAEVNEFQVKQEEKVLGKNSVFKMSDICYAEDENLCINFYKLDTSFGKAQGCSDLKIKDRDLTVRIGCFFMQSSIDFVNRQLISRHDGNNRIEYNFAGHPLIQNKFSINTWSLNTGNIQSTQVGNGDSR